MMATALSSLAMLCQRQCPCPLCSRSPELPQSHTLQVWSNLQKAVDAVQGGADQRAALEDLFYMYGVDITFCGHVHWQDPLLLHLLA